MPLSEFIEQHRPKIIDEWVKFAATLEDDVTFRVHNEGQPIPKMSLKQIFEPMVRRELPPEQSDKNPGGMGLGLYIAHEIVAAHSGSIGVTSTEKEGTTFTVKIPRNAERQKPRE